MKSIKLILLATIVLASFAVVQTTQNVVVAADVENTHDHSKNCDDDGCTVENTHKHRMNCEGGSCEAANSGSTVNDEDSHFNENCNTHRADVANDDPDSDCKDNGFFKPHADD